jgi:hypothetical protein
MSTHKATEVRAGDALLQEGPYHQLPEEYGEGATECKFLLGVLEDQDVARASGWPSEPDFAKLVRFAEGQ